MSYEKELKLLLNKEDYSQLLDSFQEISNPLNQINYYFDTNEFSLNQLGITLRIREENGEDLILCLKTKLNNLISNITISKEFEKEISRNDFYKYRDNPEYIFDYFDKDFTLSLKDKIKSNKLKYLGSIKNERRKLSFNKNYICDLDYTIYPDGRVFYEMEFEGMDSENDVINIIEYLDFKQINYRINNKSKYKRFVESINNN